MIDYTIIVPVYCNETSLEILYKEVEEKVLNRNPNLNGKIVFCDDRSTDKSYNVLKELQSKNPEIGLIRFTRNFGQTAGIYCCLKEFESKSYIIMSADLQDPVSLINEFLEHHFKNGFHIVAGVRESREDGFISSFFSSLFYFFLRKLNFSNYPKSGFDFILISRKMRDIMLNLNDSNPFWQGQMMWSGLSKKFIPYKRKKRELGVSKYTFSKRIKYFIDGIFGFSFAPIRFITIIGLIMSIIAFSFILFFVSMKIIYGEGYSISGWTSIVSLLLLGFGFQFIFLGIIGEYLWRNLDQTRKRPLYLIDKIYKNG